MSAIDIRVAATLQQPAGEPVEATPVAEPPTGAESALDFLRCDLVESKGRPLHEGEFPLAGDPSPGTAQARVELSYFATAAIFRLETEEGVWIEDIELLPSANHLANTSFFGSFDVPAAPFRIAASGQDLDGKDFDVGCDRLYTPQTVTLQFASSSSLVSAGNHQLVVTVTNHGPANTFLVSAASDLGIVVEASPDSLDLEQASSAEVTLGLTVPEVASGVLDISVTASASAEVDPNIHNTASTVLWLERFESVFGDNFE